MRKLVLAALVAASTMFGAGFGSASNDPGNILLNNQFAGKQNRFIIVTGSGKSSYYKAGEKLVNVLKGAFNATSDGSSLYLGTY